eukprot:TRINITY_DN4035_c0_g2_i1.p1 TRINITY_DN4035_c0_g2~~TRINITY_DN4035_c0_g2_i1.p1  ORF type:complete len:157 (+),score=46.75 TRINITY_DN4035_c0_g2_i1:252-722(+)
MSISDVTPAMMQAMREAFELFDKDRAEYIPVGDLASAMRAAGANPTEQEILDFISELDGMTIVDFKHFLDFVTRKLAETVPEEELRLAFQTFDRDGLGYLSLTELRIALCTMGDPLTDDEMRDLMSELEFDGNGNVDYGALCRRLLPPPTPNPTSR